MQSKLLPVKAVKASADIQQLLDEEALTETELNGLIAEVQGKEKGDLDFPSFKALLDRIDEAIESKEDDDDYDDYDAEVAKEIQSDEDKEADLSEQALEALALVTFNELRGKVGNVCCLFSLH